MCILCTPRPIYQLISRSTYRPTLDRCLGQHSSRVSADMLVDISAECRSTYRPMYQPRCRVMVDISTDYRQISRWPFIVGGILVDRRWYIGQNLRLLVYKLYAFHPFFGQLQKFLKASCSAFMCRKFSCYQARHSIEILPNTQNTVDRIEDKDDEG